MVILSTLVFTLGCNKKADKNIPPSEVIVSGVQQKDVPVINEFVGQTYGQSDIAIRARVDGFLEGIHFQEGSQVTKGQLLYSIDPAPQMAKVTEAMSKVAEAKTILAKAESDVKRYRPLAEINAVAQSDLDAAEAQYGAARASLEAAQASLDYANIQLSYTKIYSPINGFIGKTEAKVGDYVGREPNPVVLNAVSNIETILVRFSISETEYLKVMQQVATMREEGKKWKEEDKQPLELILADGSIYKYKGYVDFANRQIDPTTGTMLIQASFPNPEKMLRPGLFAKVRATMDMIKDALLIPQKAVMETQGIFSVYVVDTANTVQSTQITIGEKIGANWVVLDGLRPDDRVVVEGLQKVRTGQKVRPSMMNQNTESN
jgi:membrane fusion protein (multidrug efflux system)